MYNIFLSFVKLFYLSAIFFIKLNTKKALKIKKLHSVKEYSFFIFNL